MRGLWLAGVAGLVGGLVACSKPEPVQQQDWTIGSGSGMGNGDASDDWVDQGYTTYYGRFGGSFDAGAGDEPDTSGTGEGGDDDDQGEEYAVITDDSGELQCDWRWTTSPTS